MGFNMGNQIVRHGAAPDRDVSEIPREERRRSGGDQ